jgi:hypothetical protein
MEQTVMEQANELWLILIIFVSQNETLKKLHGMSRATEAPSTAKYKKLMRFIQN